MLDQFISNKIIKIYRVTRKSVSVNQKTANVEKNSQMPKFQVTFTKRIMYILKIMLEFMFM